MCLLGTRSFRLGDRLEEQGKQFRVSIEPRTELKMNGDIEGSLFLGKIDVQGFGEKVIQRNQDGLVNHQRLLFPKGVLTDFQRNEKY
jgi:hypothetical protein